MIGHITIRERGSTPRRLRKELNQHQKESWRETGVQFHTEMREARFTEEHAREAGYAKRKGENLPRGSRRFKRSYYGRKLVSEFGGGRGRAEPLTYTGAAKRGSRQARITSNSKGARIRYPGLRGLNRRHPKSRIKMTAEFRRVLPREADALADGHDRRLDRRLSRETGTDTQRLN